MHPFARAFNLAHAHGELVDTRMDAASGSSHSFTSVAMGTGDYIVVAAGVLSDTISSITVGGVGLTLIKDAGGSSADAAIYAGPHPGTATATVVVNTVATANSCGIAVFSVRNVRDITADYNASNFGSDVSANMAVGNDLDAFYCGIVYSCGNAGVITSTPTLYTFVPHYTLETPVDDAVDSMIIPVTGFVPHDYGASGPSLIVQNLYNTSFASVRATFTY